MGNHRACERCGAPKGGECDPLVSHTVTLAEAVEDVLAELLEKRASLRDLRPRNPTRADYLEAVAQREANIARLRSYEPSDFVTRAIAAEERGRDLALRLAEERAA